MAKPTMSIDQAGAAAAQSDEETPLSPRRAFVVQFRDRTDARDRFEGRVEHMVSGHAARFRSPAELTRFMRQVLNAGPALKEITGG